MPVTQKSSEKCVAVRLSPDKLWLMYFAPIVDLDILEGAELLLFLAETPVAQ